MRVLMFGLLFLTLFACGQPLPDRSAPAGPADTDQVPAADVPAAAVAADAATEPAASQPTTPVPQPPADSDGDGVADASDTCPGTAPGKQVDASGCEIDPDGDGVIGPADLCPTSPYGEPVDGTGCRPRLAVPQEYTLMVTFETASATIVGDPHAALAEVAALMTQYPETSVVIEGHTDNRGPPKYNMRMSQLRADAVAKVLISDLGIDAARVSTKAFGKTKPIATNATKEGRERNRRVVAVVLPAKPLSSDPGAGALNR